jgi:hypothetical protein
MESPEHERRAVVEYVEIEGYPDDPVVYAEKVHSERVFDTKHDVWDVRTRRNRRWWVVTNLLNLYPKKDHETIDHVLAFHLGLMLRMQHRQPSQPGQDEVRDSLRSVFRQMDQVFEAFDEADEAEEFQAVGVRAREALLSLVHTLAKPEMVPPDSETPKRSDFEHWSAFIADSVAPGARNSRLRAHMKQVAASTWDLVNWVTHDKNATRHTAGVAAEAASSVLALFGRASVRHFADVPDRCPKCGSYRLYPDWRSDEDAYYTLCEACGWETRRDPTPQMP